MFDAGAARRRAFLGSVWKGGCARVAGQPINERNAGFCLKHSRQKFHGGQARRFRPNREGGFVIGAGDETSPAPLGSICKCITFKVSIPYPLINLTFHPSDPKSKAYPHGEKSLFFRPVDMSETVRGTFPFGLDPETVVDLLALYGWEVVAR